MWRASRYTTRLPASAPCSRSSTTLRSRRSGSTHQPRFHLCCFGRILAIMSDPARSCGIYARISSDDGSALGVARQVDDCSKEAVRRGWTVAAEFVDNDVSASRSRARPQYQRMLEAIRAGEIDALVVWDIDRLTRTPRELEDIIDLADRHGLQLANVGGDTDLSTPNGRMTARIKGTVARQEIEQLSKRLKRKFEENRKQGLPHGITPFGYRRQPVLDESGRVVGTQDVIDAAEAEAIREIYRMVIAGDSLRSLAKYLNEKGMKTIRGNPWQGNVVGNMLRKPRYAGRYAHAKQDIGKAAWEPIISQDTYDQALAVLTAPGRRHTGGVEIKYLLSGLVQCGRCGTEMRPNISPKRKPTYACPGCMKLARQMEPVHDVVNAVMVARLSQPDVLAHLADQPDALTTAATTRDAVLARMDTAADSFARGDITGRQLARINEQLTVQLSAAETDVRRYQPVRVLDGMTGPGAAKAWAAASIERRRLIIRTLATISILPSGPGIRFTPEQVQVTWRNNSD
nr:recombinase family protein [Arthrobacter agilis]